MRTARCGVARVVGAGIKVVATDRRASAATPLAHIILRAGVAVVTRSAVRLVRIRAGAVAITRARLMTLVRRSARVRCPATSAVRTHIVLCTGITVVTRSIIRGLGRVTNRGRVILRTDEKSVSLTNSTTT